MQHRFAHPRSRRSSAPRTRVSGFTLVELLVVIGIIALLMSILLPTLGRVREQANSIKCGSNIRQLVQAFIMYAKDNKDYFPAGARYPATSGDGKNIKSYDWIWYQEKAWAPNRPTPDLNQSAIVPFMGGSFTPEAFRCPSDSDAEVRAINGSNTEPYTYSYAMNAYFEYRPEAPANIVKSSQIRNPSSKILVVEEDEQSINDGLWSPGGGDLAVVEPRDLLAIRHDRLKKQPDPRDQDLRSHPNAERMGNAGFVDGHVEYIVRKEAHKAERIKREK